MFGRILAAESWNGNFLEEFGVGGLESVQAELMKGASILNSRQRNSNRNCGKKEFSATQIMLFSESAPSLSFERFMPMGCHGESGWCRNQLRRCNNNVTMKSFDEC
jgi:hypothetical protein